MSLVEFINIEIACRYIKKIHCLFKLYTNPFLRFARKQAPDDRF